MNNVSTLPGRAPVSRNLDHLPIEEAFEVEIGEAVEAATALMRVLHGNNITSERLELAHAVEYAEQHVDLARSGLAILQRLERPATSREISEHLAILLGCLTGSKGDKATFGKMLMIDVRAAAPSIGAIETACRKLRRTCTFVPSIAEVLKALDEAKSSLKVNRWQLERLPNFIDDGRRRIEQRRQFEAEERERRRKRIRDAIASRRSLWDFNQDEVAEVNAEMMAEGLPGIQEDW